MLASEAFRRSPRRAGLLRFVVEETLEGRADRIKGVAVAMAVFGRDESFDSQSDPVVRLEARRLRHDIDAYYAEEGRDAPVRISLPKGGYVPCFARQASAEAPSTDTGQTSDARSSNDAPPKGPISADAIASPPRSPPRSLLVMGVFAALVLSATAAMTGYLRLAGPQDEIVGPAVIVLPFDALSDVAEDRQMASGLTYEVIADLTRFAAFRVYSPSASFGRGPQDDPQVLRRDLGVSYVVKGALRSDGDRVWVVAQLYDATSGRVVWSDRYERVASAGALIEVQKDLAASIATALGEPYGEVRADLMARVSRGMAPSMPSYSCILEAYDYRRSFDAGLYQPTLDCLEASVRRDPDYAAAWAMLGWLRLDAARFRYVPAERKQETLDQAIEAANRAVHLDRSDPLGLQALAAALYCAGRYDESMDVQRRALALNENDPDAMAQLGWRLAARGAFYEGVAYLERAIARSANPPGWYFHLIAVRDYLAGDYAHMLDAAERSAVDGSGISWSLVAIARAALGQQDEARAALDRWASIDPQAYADPTAEYRMHGATEDTANALAAGLRAAGWTMPKNPTN